MGRKGGTRVLGPALDRERPESGGEPGVENVLVLVDRERGRRVLGAELDLGLGRRDLERLGCDPPLVLHPLRVVIASVVNHPGR